MDLTPEDVLHKSFSMTLRRGYEKDEVDDFLEQVARALQATIESAESARARADQAVASTNPDPLEVLGDEVKAILRTAHESAAMMQKRIVAEAEQIRDEARKHAAAARSKVERETEVQLSKARDQANEIVGRARHEAETLLTEARKQCGELLDDAKATHEHLKEQETDLVARVAAAEATMAALKNDLGMDRSGAEVPADGANSQDDAHVIRLEPERRGAKKS